MSEQQQTTTTVVVRVPMTEMSDNELIKDESEGHGQMPDTNGWYNVMDPCDECTQKRHNCGHFRISKALACLGKPRPHPVPKTRRVHVSKASEKAALPLNIRLFSALIAQRESDRPCG